MIQRYVEVFTIDRKIQASFHGQSGNDIIVLVGGMGPKVRPIIAFAPDGRVYTGSLQASIGEMATGEIVFNAYRANLVTK